MALRPVRHRKRAVLARVEAEFRALDGVVRRLRDFRRPVPRFGERARIRRERWTVQDALAHVVEWKRQTYRGLTRAGSDPELRGRPIAEKNRLIYERWHRRSPAEVAAFHREVHRSVMRALRSLPDDFSRERPRSPLSSRTTSWGHSAAHRRRHLESLLSSS